MYDVECEICKDECLREAAYMIRDQHEGHEYYKKDVDEIVDFLSAMVTSKCAVKK